MIQQADSAGKLSTIDLLFSLLDDPRRAFDFTLIFHLRESPGVEALRAGALSARNFYPTTGSRVVNKRWVRFDEPGDGLAAVSIPAGRDATDRIEEFVDSPLDLREQTPVRQLLITDGTGAKLVTRFHHAAADGLSAAMWLGHQLRVAYGEEPPAAEASPFETLPLRTHPSPVRRSRFAHAGPSDRLWSPGIRPSRTRRRAAPRRRATP